MEAEQNKMLDSGGEDKGNLDFSWLEKSLEQRKIPVESVLTPENRNLLSTVKHYYQLSDHDIKKALLITLTKDSKLEQIEFKRNCHDIYKSKERDYFKTEKQPNYMKSKEEKLIDLFETLTSKQLLAYLSGNKALEKDINVVHKIRATHKIPEPVMNVLIHYVLLQNDMKLPARYLEKVASHWSGRNLKTAKEAMDFAKKKNTKYSELKKKSAASQDSEVDSSSTPTTDIEKPFTLFEYRYTENLFNKYSMNFDVSREIILYGREVNNGLLIYWFLDAVSDYVYRHNGKNAEDTRDLLDMFHNKFVENFGKEKNN